MRFGLIAICVLLLSAGCGGGAAVALPLQIDADIDGVWDADDFFPNDTDNDGFINAVDPDDDNDGVGDDVDRFPFDPSESVDTDGDGLGDRVDSDDDNDGVADGADAFPLDATESSDADGDLIGDTADADDDNDGYGDAVDLAPLDAAAAGDGDGDGIDSMRDADGDGDGYADAIEIAEASDPFDANAQPQDTDADFLTDEQERNWHSDVDNADTDGDGVRDDAEYAAQTDPRASDTDADGIDDVAEFGVDPRQPPDFDGDGVIDARDAYRVWALQAAPGADPAALDRFGLDLADDGRWCAADYLADAVRVYAADGTLERTLGGVQAPNDCALLADDGIVVADTTNDRVVRFAADGSVAATYEHQPDGTPGGFLHPRAVTTDAAGDWYVADTWNNRIQRFTPVTAQWRVVAPTLALRDPQDVAVAADGAIAIADTGNYRVVLLDAQERAVRDVTAATLGLAPLSFAPRSVAFGPDGALYIVDAASSRVVVAASDGTLLRQFGGAGTAAHQLAAPSAIAIDAAGRVRVNDATRVQEW